MAVYPGKQTILMAHITKKKLFQLLENTIYQSTYQNTPSTDGNRNRLSQSTKRFFPRKSTYSGVTGTFNFFHVPIQPGNIFSDLVLFCLASKLFKALNSRLGFLFPAVKVHEATKSLSPW